MSVSRRSRPNSNVSKRILSYLALSRSPHGERIVLYLGGPGAGQGRQEANVSQRILLYRVLVLAPGAWKPDVSHVSWCIRAPRGRE